MCGISGIWGLSNSAETKNVLAEMNNALSHRGPDDEGLFISEGIALGHRRLAIIDLSPAGHQPMFIENNRYAMVFNGEIYNYREIRKEIPNVHFVSDSDSEVIMHAYHLWGKDCVKRFNGMWAIVIYDKEKNELFISRDRLGVKPLYYYQTNNQLYFSSELRSLLTVKNIPRKLNKTALNDYLLYQTVHAPATIIEGVKMLMPGHNALANNSGIYIEQYWNIDSNNQNNNDTLSVAKEKVKDLFFDSIRLRLIADVPFGAFLSGGIDSSGVVAAMSKVSTNQIKTFNISFSEEHFSEAKYARKIAELYKTEHHEIQLSVEHFKNELPNALNSMDFPSGDGPNTYVVSKATKEAGVTMALTGLGGDELFGGYNVFSRTKALLRKNQYAAIPLALRKIAGSGIRFSKPGTQSDKIEHLLNLENWNAENTYPLSRLMLSKKEMSSLGMNPSLNQTEVKKLISLFNKSDLDSVYTFISKCEMSTYMQNVLLRDADQMSMAHALELRVPFLDYRLVEYVLSLPDLYKIGQSPKQLFVEALGDLLPSDIVNRPKMGFTLPWEDWMKKDLREFCESRILQFDKRISSQVFGEKWKNFLASNSKVKWSALWYVVVLEDWLQKNSVN